MSGLTSAEVKAEALRIGFVACGVVKLDPSKRADALDRWLAAGYAGTMGYLPRQKRKRKDPALITPGATHAVMVLDNYAPPREQRDREGESFHVASYARGMDYHYHVHGRLHRLSEWMKGRGVELAHTWVDDSPVPERELAERAGLGWIGKNTMLINPELGSFTIIGSIFTDAELEVDQPLDIDRCGSCTRCLEACPTGALLEPRLLDATRCISYLTIESKAPIPDELAERMSGWAFGCDICNEVCPWNVKFADALPSIEFGDRGQPDRHNPAAFEQMSEDEFRQLHADTPLARPGLERMRSNVRLAVASRTSVHDTRPPLLITSANKTES